MSKTNIWLVSIVSSGVLLVGLLSLADRHAIVELSVALSWPLIALAFALFQFEGTCSALRLHWITDSHNAFIDSLAVTAWWVAALALLPARLGEIAGMRVFSRRLKQSFGSSLHCLLLQRLMDTAWLLFLGFCLLLVHADRLQSALPIAGVCVAGIVLFLVMMRLDAVFALSLRALLPYRRVRATLFVLKVLAQGRRAAKQLRARDRLIPLAAVSLLKWLLNLAALALLAQAIMPALAALDALAASIAFNLAAIVPLQTVGGVGLGDFTFLGVLAWYGYGISTTASAAVLFRVALIVAPLSFFVWVLLVDSVTTGAATHER